jgi:hypothetical protein
MIRKFVVSAGLLAVVGALGGCFSLTNYDEDTRMINKWGSDLHDVRILTCKYFFNYDPTDPYSR